MSLEPVNAAIDALKSSPAMLAVVILALSFAGLTYAALQADRDRQKEQVESLIERCFPLFEEEKE